MSDLPVEADHENWSEDDLRPYIDATIETFGFDRTIFVSDYPVCLQATSVTRGIEVLDVCHQRFWVQRLLELSEYLTHLMTDSMDNTWIVGGNLILAAAFTQVRYAQLCEPSNVGSTAANGPKPTFIEANYAAAQLSHCRHSCSLGEDVFRNSAERTDTSSPAPH